MEEFTVGGLTARKGTKVSGFVPVEGTNIKLPVTLIYGEEEGETVLISGGVHNAEYVGIQSAIQLATTLTPDRIVGKVIIIHLMNPSGFEHRTMSLVYEDGKNLNRVFPGGMLGTTADRIAYTVEKEFFPKADYYIDLHCGDGFEGLVSYVYCLGNASEYVVRKSREMAEIAHVDLLVESQSNTGGAYNYAGSLGIPSILIERGGHSYWTWEEVEQDKRDVRHLVFHLQGKKCHGLKHYRQMLLENVVYEYAPYTGCWYPSKKPGEYFFKGEELGELKDYYGNLLYTSIATENGVVLYQTASLNIIEDGPMIAYAAITETLT